MRNKKGYTLVEVIISFVLIVTVMIYMLRTIIVLVNKNNDLLVYEEYSVYENVLLKDVYDDIDIAYDLDSFLGLENNYDQNKIIFKDINKELVINEENRQIIYDGTIYELPENVEFRKVDNKIYKVSDLHKSTHEYYVITIYTKVNDNDEEIKIVYQNKNEPDLEITFDPNGGSAPVPSEVITKKYGEEIGPLPTTSKTNNDFFGWYTDRTDGTQISDKTIVKESTTYYAHWDRIYQIAYNLNGGSLPSGKTNPTTYKKGNSFTLNNPSKIGYTFKGWTGTGLSSKTVTVEITSDDEGDRAYTANYDPSVYAITYYYNGGSAPSSGVPSNYTYGVGATVNGKPTKSGYKFNGWSTASSLTSPAFTKTISKTATGAKSFYAKWCQNCASVSNGSCSLNADTAGTCKYTTSCNTGYTISGNGTRNPTCTANTFTVAYNGNGATSGSTSSHKCTYNGTCTLKSNGFTKTGYTFTGWKKGNTGNTLSAGTSIKNAATSGTVTYYAQWTPKTYTVTYKGNGGSSSEWGTEWSNTATYNSNYYIYPNWYKYKGHTFSHWYGSDNQKWTAGNTWKWTYTTNVTLKAIWKPTVYYVRYHGNGNTDGKGNWTSSGFEYGKTISIEKNWYTKSGSTFQGWCTQGGYCGWTAGGSWTMSYDNGEYGIGDEQENYLDLYAKWSNSSTTNTCSKRCTGWKAIEIDDCGGAISNCKVGAVYYTSVPGCNFGTSPAQYSNGCYSYRYVIKQCIGNKPRWQSQSRTCTAN